MASVENWLTSIRLEEYIPKFKDEAIEFSCLDSLTDDMISILIPKMGHQIIFKRKLRELCESGDIENSELNNGASTFSTLSQNKPLAAVESVKEEPTNDTMTFLPQTMSSFATSADESLGFSFTRSDSTPPNKKMKLSTIEESELNSGASTSSGLSHPKSPNWVALEVVKDEVWSDVDTPPPFSSNILSSSSVPSDEGSLGFTFNRNDDVASFKRIRISTLPEKFDLKDLLQKSCIGKAILSLYDNQKFLDTRSQNYLVEIIVLHFLDQDYGRLTNDAFNRLSDEIVKVFPNEHKLVYYTPPVRKSQSRDNIAGIAKGKLVDKYRNTLTYLRKAKIIPSRVEYSDDQSSVISNNFDTTGALTSKEWLQKNNEPWEKVFTNWGNCFELRRLQHGVLSIEEHFKEYPVLKCTLGHLLIENDFSRSYLDKDDALFTHFENVFNKILKLRKTHLQASDTILLDVLETRNIEQDYKHYIMLTLLFSLVPCKRHNSTKKGQRFWKPSITESREGFIMHIKVAEEIEESMNNRREKMLKHGLTVQPYIMVQGPSISNICKIYVVINATTYTVPTLLKAIDICFKSFHVFGTKYPVESEHIWLLIQSAVYQLETIWDKNVPYIIDICNKIRLL